MTLAEASRYAPTPLAQGIMETFVIESPLLDRLPLMPIAGNAYAYNMEQTLPGVAFRGVNEAYIESTGTIVQATEKLSILGGDADVDKFLEQTTPSDLGSLRANQARMKVKSSSYKFQDTFINGDVAVDSKAFDGLKKRIAGSQVIDTATNGMGPVAGGHDFFDALDALMAAVDGGADALYTNAAIRARILSAGRRLGGAETIREDSTGKRVATWHGVPVLDIGTRADGTPIIPQTETQGSSSAASSIYAVKFGQDESDGGTTGITNGGVQVYDLGEIDSKPVYRTRIEFYVGLASFGPKASARLRGVLNS
ncbi:major capsid protein [Pseudonocardia sediminis]